MPFLIFRGGPNAGPSNYERDDLTEGQRVIFDDVAYIVSGETVQTSKGPGVYADFVE